MKDLYETREDLDRSVGLMLLTVVLFFSSRILMRRRHHDLALKKCPDAGQTSRRSPGRRPSRTSKAESAGVFVFLVSLSPKSLTVSHSFKK